MLVSLFALAFSGTPERAPGKLEAAAQTLVDTFAQKHGYSLQLAWYCPTGETFSVAAGKTAAGGTATPKDTFLFGSGTKPYTASLVMQLAEAGVLSVDEKAAPSIDKAMKALGSSSTLEDLFGSQAAQITIGQLIHMQTGINDFDVPDWDAQVPEVT